jgi:hypothetical protein
MNIKIILRAVVLVAAFCIVSGCRDSGLNASYDVVVYGGTPAGIMASIQLAREGKSVALVEPSCHIGGIIVNGLGGTDIDNHREFRNSPAVGGLALEFYQRIAQEYGRLEEFERSRNSGGKDPMLWRFEPHVAEEVIGQFLAEYPISIFLDSPLSESQDAVRKMGPVIQSIRTVGGTVLQGKVFIDASLEGDLLAAAGVSVTWGREGNDVYGETKNGIRGETTHAQFAVKVDPYVIPGDPSSGLIATVQDDSLGTPGAADKAIQAYCFRMCLTENPDNRIPFTRPEHYDRSQYEIYLRYLRAGGKLYVPRVSIPNGKTDLGAWHDLSHNLYGMNHEYPNGDYAIRQAVYDRHRQFTQGLFYFLANDTEVGQLDSSLQNTWKRWGLCRDEFVDNDGWPRQLYIRDARRMVSNYVITEHHTLRDNPVTVKDPVAVAYWPPDLHSARRIVKDGYAYNEGFVFGGDSWRPFGISYRSLVPRREECSNILTPTCLSSSHVAYGAIRIEFTYMALGQACGMASAWVVDNSRAVQEVDYKKLREKLLEAGQVVDASAVGMPGL